MKIREVIERLLKWHVQLPLNPEHPSADTFKIGDPEQECTGVAVTVHCTVDVVKEAAAKNCNLIITHEPLFYGDDEQKSLDPEDPVYLGKKKLLEENGIVVWRDHDHMHGSGGPGVKIHTETDYIYHGIMRELGWDDYVEGETTKPLWFRIPETDVRSVAKLFLEKFDLTGLRVVGDPDAKVSTVFVCEHINGRGPMDAEKVKDAAKADVLVPLEIVDWTVSEYVRDSAQLGFGKAILEMGHFNTEELGMKYMVKWLPEAIGEDIPVYFVKSGDSFSYILR